MSRKAFIWMGVLAAMIFAACAHKTQSECIPFEVAHNYFVRNDVSSVPVKIDSQEAFSRYFGMATFLGKNGQPTPIDFSREFVIAIVLPETTHSTEIAAKKLMDEEDGLALSYELTVNEKENTWTQVPVQLLVVSREYERDSVKLRVE